MLAYAQRRRRGQRIPFVFRSHDIYNSEPVSCSGVAATQVASGGVCVGRVSRLFLVAEMHDLRDGRPRAVDAARLDSCWLYGVAKADVLVVLLDA